MHLLRLVPSTNTPTFVQLLQKSADFEVILASTPRYWVVSPTSIDASISSANWDLLVVLQPTTTQPPSLPTSVSKAPAGPSAAPAPTEGDAPAGPPSPRLPADLAQHVAASYALPLGVPSQLLASYADHNADLLNAAASKPAGGWQTGAYTRAKEETKASSSQNLEADPKLLEFADRLVGEYGEKPVTMLNLLAFNKASGKPGRQSYLEYGRRFKEAGGRRGGDAKIVGRVVDGKAEEGEGRGWDEVALVHYPSIRAFCDMAAGEDYQEVNRKYRLPVSCDPCEGG